MSPRCRVPSCEDGMLLDVLVGWTTSTYHEPREPMVGDLPCPMCEDGVEDISCPVSESEDLDVWACAEAIDRLDRKLAAAEAEEDDRRFADATGR